MSLDRIALRSHWVTLGGALGSLLASVGRELPQPYVMGASGLAFRLTLDAVVSAGSPMEINFHDQLPLWENLGVWFRRSVARPGEPHYPKERAEVLRRVSESLARGWPAIGYDLLDLPEYGLIVGAEVDRLACLTLDNPAEPGWMGTQDWPPPGRGQLARVEAITLLDVAPSFDRRRAEVASLRFAVEHFWAPASRDGWLKHGQKGYEFWAVALASPMPLHGGEGAAVGHAYNLMVLQRARQDAAAYLSELARRYPEAPSLATAAARFSDVAGTVAAATEVLPFPAAEGADEPARQAVAAKLRQAAGLERAGIDEIEKALRALR